MAPKRRRPRVDELVKEAVAEIIEREIADPRLTFLTVTDASVSADARVATVYYTTLHPDLLAGDNRGGDPVHAPDEVDAGLDSALPRIQALLGRRVQLRHTPTLRFEPDPVARQASRVEAVLRDLREDAGDELDGDGEEAGPA